MQRRFVLHHLAAAAALTLAGSLLPAVPAQADAPKAGQQAPGVQRWKLGDFEVTALSDGTVDLPADELLHQPPAATRAALAKANQRVPLETSVNAFLVNTGPRLVLVDVGAGALFGPTLGKLMASLRAAGHTPEQVDDIVLTHIHPDHVGGLIDAAGARAFPNATVHADRRDGDHWLSAANLAAAPAASKGFYQGAVASLSPYVAAGRFQAFDAGAEIVPGLKSSAAYGHTPGHTVYTAESQGARLLLTGDLIHVAAVQFDRMGVTIAFDSDPARAAAARRAVFAQAAREGSLVAAAHLPFPGVGRLRTAQGGAYRWVPADYTTQLK